MFSMHLSGGYMPRDESHVMQYKYIAMQERGKNNENYQGCFKLDVNDCCLSVLKGGR